MRRSNAPSMRKAKAAEERRKLDQLFDDDHAGQEEVSSSTACAYVEPWGTKGENQESKENFDAFSGKIIFNVVWREVSKKKHKTWDGDGILEVQLTTQRAVMKDSTGKYMGTNTKFKLEEMQEGFQLMVGGKEVELLEQITDRNEYFAMRKRQVANRWLDEELEVENQVEAKKPKLVNVAPMSSKADTFKKLQNATSSSKVKQKNINEDMQWQAPESGDDKVIFNIVWRNITAKKHKTWDGDGTLEFTTNCRKAVLRDERAQAIGCLENINLDDLISGSQFVTEDKEFELLEPFTSGTIDTTRTMQTISKHIQPVEHRKSKSSLEDKNCFVLPEPPTIYLNELNTTNRPIQQVQVCAALSKHLRPHQRAGVAFIYSCLMGFHNPAHRGCILADEMGLGKTLQCIALAHTLLRQGPYGGERVLQRVLIVTPCSLTANWEQEINKWLQGERMYAFVVGGKHKLSTYSQQHHVPFVIVSYESLLMHVAEFQRLKFDLLICDEGHRLKNQTTKIVCGLRDLNVPRRIILTGTPVQNDLQEFFSLADFVNPGIFGSYQEFRKYYELPLQRSQCPEAGAAVKLLAAERTQELMCISEQFVLRRLQEVNCQYLPKKHEYICFVQPSELQQFMLQKALEYYEKRKETLLKDLTPLQMITVLKKICNHPSLVARTKTPNLFTRNLERYLPEWSEMGPFDSAKLELVQHFLVATAVQRGEKCVLVSNHTKTLNMLQGLCDFLNVKCLRLDGTMPMNERNANVEKFNSNANDELVFLLSAKAGGVGLNLIGASRLILFDNDWNPATDAQAMSRIWRDGQRRDVQIYRLITAGCIEEKIFQRQVFKLSLGDCVMQGGTSKAGETMKFSADELLDLFTLQTDFSVCQTHESLNCNCMGDGENLLAARKSGKQINELMQWQHYKPPFDADLLQKTCLDNVSENLLYIFANETDLT